MAYLNDDEILIVDTNNDRIRQANIQTATVVKTLGKEGLGIGDFDIPGDVCYLLHSFFLLLMARTVSFLMCNNRRLGFVSLFFFSKKLYQIQPN